MHKLFVFVFCCIFVYEASSQTISFTYTNLSGTTLCSPASLNFTPVYTGNPIGFTWYFGNGQTSNSAIPTMVFSTGTYTVKLVAVFANVALETTQTIIVNASATASLTANTNYICKLDTINFNCTTTANSPTFLYDFGDGSTPITSTSNNTFHNYTNFGLFSASVNVTSINGCAASANYTVEVKKPPIVASVTPVNGCAPKNVNFSCAVYPPQGSDVTSYNWIFGDGSPAANTTTSSIPHTYIDSGTYFPILNITTIDGCSNSYTFPKLVYGLAPFIQYAYPNKLVYCGNETAQFVAKANNANQYKWEYEDGSIDFVTDTVASHKYNTLGIKTVKVTPIYNDCAGIPFSFTINIIGVIAKYSFKNSCSAKKIFTFTNLSQGNQSITNWNFGDGSADANTTNAIHTFPASGSFNTTLIVKDNISSCADTISFPIYTATPTLINPDTFLCRNATTTYTILNNYVNPSVTNFWNVLGILDTITTGNIPYTPTASQFGNFNSHTLIITNGIQYCPDTIVLNKLISVRGPILSFSPSTSLCTNNNFIITNNSTSFAVNDTIKIWHWTFGIPGLKDTAYQPTPFIYSAEGNYNLKLIAKDKKGCTDSLEKNILVKESPFLRMFPRSAIICEGQKVTLTAYHTDNLIWSPANIVTCATCDTTIASPTTTTKIFAIASNAVGCSLKDSTVITVSTAFDATTSINTLIACRNNTVQLEVNPPNKKIVWSPSFGLNNGSIYKPIATVLKDTTTYTALLTDSAGCFSSSINVKVISYPLAIVDAGLNRTLAYNTPFTISPIYSSDVTNYLWEPLGNLTCNNCATPSGFADSSRTYTIKVTTSKNCVAKDTISIFVECSYANLYMASAFSPDNTIAKKYYYPQTRAIKMIKKFAVFNRYGKIMYEIKNTMPNIRYNGWDGKHKGIDQASGGYVYMLEAICEKGEILNKKGSFLLIR